MRSLMLTALLSTVALAAPAQARNGEIYLGADFGVTLVNGETLSVVPGVVGSNGTIRVGQDLGFDGGIFAGYDLGPVRLEAEASYRSADFDTINSSFSLGNIVAAGERQAGGGHVNVLSFMGNALLDLGDESGLSFFIGGGAGYAKVRYQELRTFSNQGVVLDDWHWGFAWQGLAGIRQALNENVDITLRYRFFNAPGVELVGFGGRAVDADFRSHSLMGGITFNF